MIPAIQAAWATLEDHGRRLEGRHLRDLFANDPDRFQSLSVAQDGLLIDASKEKLDQAAIEALIDLALATNVEAKRDALFAGDAFNSTEGRAALHMALRAPDKNWSAHNQPVSADIKETLSRVLAFADQVRNRDDIDDVVSIGIGGSDLGPAMATLALSPYADGPNVHFVSNVDGADVADTLATLNPERSLIIVQSKTFTTVETMTNAATAKAWLAKTGRPVSDRLAAVSTNVSAAQDFGIDAENVFGFWDWVGGRYSIWSAIGLPVAIAIGPDHFRAFLAGAAVMDDHFQTAGTRQNLPILMGLISIWRRNILGCSSVCVAPYDQRLRRFPAYLQQLTMESNGKRVTADGQPAHHATCPVVWGEPGTNAQHSFFQLLHQGTDIIPVDFLIAAQPTNADEGHHHILLANALAQSQALAFGLTEQEARAQMAGAGVSSEDIDHLAAHRTFPGDRPSTTLLYKQLDPETLGRLIALYEHKTFVEAAVWGINPFDQWGVELGKALATKLLPVLAEGSGESLDASTAGLLAHRKHLLNR